MIINIFNYNVVNAQQLRNYALNGSFESISSCPDGEGDIILAQHYFNGIGTSTDLFARCGSPDVGVPKNRVGLMNAYHGNNMAGIMATTKGYDYYDYIIGTLDYKDMIPGQNYCVSMKVSLAYQSPWALDQLAISFCDSSSWRVRKYSNGQTINYNPLYSNDYPFAVLGLDQDLAIREKWIIIKGEITYKEGMKYFWIGANHKEPKILTPVNDVQKVFNPDRTVYYYVDDIKIVEASNSIHYFKAAAKAGCKSTQWTVTLDTEPDSVLWYLDGNLFQKGKAPNMDYPFSLDLNDLIAHAYFGESCNPIIYTADPSLNYKVPPVLNQYYPNPCSHDEIKLNIYQRGKATTTIYDISGRKIQEIEYAATERFNTIIIPVQTLVPALYLIKTQSNNCYWIQKVLVE